MLRHVLFVLLILVFVPHVCGADYATLDSKARRFAAHGEWASASAMYSLMIEEMPADASLYSRAIVAEGMLENMDAEIRLLHEALQHGVVIDSLFAGVKRESISLGKASLYPAFLETAKREQPWLSRSIDGYLLDYYTFRRDAEGMIKYARILLDGLPDNEYFLSILASGYMQGGRYGQGCDVYKSMLELNSRSRTALLALGNYYAMQASEKDSSMALKALPYLEEAYRETPTPFVAEQIKKLQGYLHN